MATDDANRGLAYRALPFSAVRDALTGCRARAIVIVLDCCFAGRAGGSPGQNDDGLAAAQVRGSYLLAAAAHDELALAPPGERCTAFTGALVGLLREGDPRGPAWLTLGDAYRVLARVLPAAGECGLAAVIGPSGSGKSSLLRAGLIPAIERSALGVPGSAGWPVVLLTPGEAPLARLGAALGALARMTPVPRHEDAMAGTFPGNGQPGALVVFALRADFYGRGMGYPALMPALRDRQVLAGPMTDGEPRDVITGPADDVALLWSTDPRAAVARLCQALRGPSLAEQWAALRTGLGEPPC